MKRKIALSLVVAVVLSLMPANVSAVRLGGGAIPIVPRGDITVNAGSPFLRSIVFNANDFPVGINNVATMQAVIIVNGLEDGELIRYTGVGDGIGAGRVPNAAAVALMGTGFNLSAANVLSAGSAINAGGAAMYVIMVRDGNSSNRAILHIMVDSGGQVVPAGFGASVPIAYTATGDSRVEVSFRWPPGFSGVQSNVTMGQVVRSGQGENQEQSEDQSENQIEKEQIENQNEVADDLDVSDDELLDEVTDEISQPTLVRLVIGETEFSVNGIVVESDLVPFIDPAYNRTMVPLRMGTEALGAQVSWIEEIRTVTIAANGQFLSLQVDVSLPDDMGTPMIVNDRTFVPIAYIAQALGANVRWDGENRAVYIQQ